MNPSKNQSSPGVLLGMSLREIAAVLSRGKWRLLTTFLVILVTVIVLTFLMKPTYESTASLLVDTRQSPSSLFEDARSLGMTIDIMQNEMAVLGSHSLAEDVASLLISRKFLDSANQVLLPIVIPLEDDSLNPLIASPTTVVERMAKTVTFTSERESYVITITATSTNPREAAMIANTYAEAYSDRNIFAARAKSRSFREFLGAQLSEKRSALQKKEDSLQTYMQRSGVVSLDEETRQLMEQMGTLEAQRDANEIEIRSLLSTLASYKVQIDQQEKSIAKSIGEASDPYIRLLQEQLAQLEVQRDITVAQNPLLIKQGVNNERLREIDTQINDLRKKLQERTQEYVENILPSGDQTNLQQDPTGYLKQIKQKFLETQIGIQTLQAKRDAMNEALRPYERKFASVPGKTIELARLSRERSSLEQLFALLETKYNEANVTEQSEFGYVEIFDPAVAPAEPSSPNLILNIALGIVLGLGMAVAFTFAKDFLEQRLYSPEDLIRRGFVPLSTIGALDAGHGASAMGTDGSGKKHNAYRVAIANPSSGFTEAFRHLRTNLYSARNATPPKTIMVTSPSPGEGKTTVASNLSVILAQSGKKVLLVDADMRDPAVHKAFGVDSKVGLAQVLTGKMSDDKAIRETQVPNLSVLSSGSSSTNPAELLESTDMRFLVTQLSERFDVVVFDSPPVLAVSDALILSMLVQSVIVVVSAGMTTSTTVERATEALSRIGANVTGIVLNNFDLTRAYGFLSSGSGYGYYGYAERYGKNGVEGKRKGVSKPGVA